MPRSAPILTVLSIAGATALAACGASSGSTAVHRSRPASSASAPRATALPVTKHAGAPPSRPPTAASNAGAPGGPPGGGTGSSSPTYTDTGAYTQKGGAATLASRTFTASGIDESGVLVTSGTLTLTAPKVTTSGSTRSSDSSSFYGLDAGILVQPSGKLVLTGGSVTTSGTGANGVFAYGSGANVILNGTSITATGNGAHGVMASGGGTLHVMNAVISTAGQSSAAIATDRGGGTIMVNGGQMMTSGFRSPGIYSTGTIVARDATMRASGAEAAVVEGANSIAAIDDTLYATKEHGVMLYNSMSGDAIAGTAHYTMIGGSLSAAQGPAFYVTNTTAVITISSGAQIDASSGVLLRSDNAGTGSGNTGAGKTTIILSDERLIGDLITGGSGTISATLRNGTTLSGRIDAAALTLDSSSRWVLTGDSTLTSLSDAGAISGSTITNIVGDGHSVTYDASLSANSALGGKTYTLSGGGVLKPA